MADPNVLAVLTDFSYTVDVPDLVQTGNNVSIPSSGAPVAYNTEYNVVPNVQIQIVGGSAGDDELLTSKTISGFNIQVVNGGVGVARIIDWVAQGY